jgi:hypothetical protein
LQSLCNRFAIALCFSFQASTHNRLFHSLPTGLARPQDAGESGNALVATALESIKESLSGRIKKDAQLTLSDNAVVSRESAALYAENLKQYSSLAMRDDRYAVLLFLI